MLTSIPNLKLDNQSTFLFTKADPVKITTPVASAASILNLPFSSVANIVLAVLPLGSDCWIYKLPVSTPSSAASLTDADIDKKDAVKLGVGKPVPKELIKRLADSYHLLT